MTRTHATEPPAVTAVAPDATHPQRLPLLETWVRRAISIPLFVVLWLAVIGTLPSLLLFAAAVDAIRKRRWATVRCMTFFALYLCCEVAGIMTSFGLWLADIMIGRDPARFVRWNFVLQQWWAAAVFFGGVRIFGMRVEIDGAEVLDHGPILLFIRHASIGDTVLAAVFISRRHDLLLRYVLKRELLWDPCLDIVGNRLPNYFVRRGSGEGAREIAGVQQLAEGLGPRDGVLIYPEGTRFTAAKRARILERLREAGDDDIFRRAAALHHVLPPRLGGPLGLLEANPGADAVFCAHIGFEGAGSFRDLLNGSLVEQVIGVQFWRVPFAQIPTERARRAEWLYDQWARIDDWIATRKLNATKVP